MHHNRIVCGLTSIIVVSSLTACSITPKYTESASADSLVAKNLQDSLSKIEKTQSELVQAGGIEQSRNGISSQIYFDNQSVSFEWYGDASTALQKLANQRGFRYYASGVKLPLPIAIDVKNISYTALLQRLQTQIGYRASVDVDHSRREISLRYTEPNARGADTKATLRAFGEPYAGAKPLLLSNTGTSTAPVASTGSTGNPLHIFRGGGAKGQSLQFIVQQIIPQGWKSDISQPILDKYKAQRFTWVGNDWWPQVLDKTLSGTQLKTSIDTAAKKVTLTDPSIVAAHSDSSSQTEKSTITSGPLIPNQKPLSTGSKPSTGTLLSVAPVGQEWTARSGSTLKESITEWASHASCSRGGSWIVMWPTNVDYGIAAPVTFRGNFEEAIVKMFDLYSAAEKPLYVLANRNQCLIAVDDKPQN